jgi:hypothetical protein
MPEKKIVIWSPDAKDELRAIDRETALRILHAVDHYLTTGAGDVIKLQPPRSEFRLALATNASCSCAFTPAASKSCMCATARSLSVGSTQSWLEPSSFTKLATNDFASPNSIRVLSM